MRLAMRILRTTNQPSLQDLEWRGMGMYRGSHLHAQLNLKKPFCTWMWLETCFRFRYIS